MVYDSKFSLTNLNFLEEYMTELCRDLRVLLGKNSYLCRLILEVPGSFYCRSFGITSVQPVRHPIHDAKCGRRRNFSLPSRFFCLI